MPRALAGEVFGPGFLERLPAGVDPCGENGEFHTCVIAGPMFARPLQVQRGEVVEREGFVYADILLAEG
jgi:diphthamide synthase (EF-2-diphthine--ammonia ligase)